MSFLHHLPPVSQGQFRLKDLVYPVACASLSAHYENTILITDGEPEILTLFEDPA